MPPERNRADDPAEWMRRAESNLARAKDPRPLPKVLLADLCFDAQQAAEKAIKGLLTRKRIGFPKTHAIEELLSLLQVNGVDVPPEVRRAGRLTDYAVESRYPGLAEDVTAEDRRIAVELAERVVEWVRTLLALPPV